LANVSHVVGVLLLVAAAVVAGFALTGSQNVVLYPAQVTATTTIIQSSCSGQIAQTTTAVTTVSAASTMNSADIAALCQAYKQQFNAPCPFSADYTTLPNGAVAAWLQLALLPTFIGIPVVLQPRMVALAVLLLLFMFVLAVARND
jgi:hypothetical protein